MSRAGYEWCDPSLSSLEIRWSTACATGIECAQLLGDWYATPSKLGGNTFVAFGIGDIDSILEDYNLKLDFDNHASKGI